MNPRQLFRQTLPDLDEHQAQAVFFLIVQHLTGLDRTHALLQPDCGITPDLRTPFLDILRNLSLGLPVQYAIGAAEFCSLRFKVNKNVLIPRPETQELVRHALRDATDAAASDTSVPSILDIGTGSGCIAVALRHLLDQQHIQARIDAVDVSPAALKTARANAQDLHADVRFLLGNVLLADFNPSDNPYDLIISNPPYVRESERESIDPSVLNFEPHQALFVPDNDPLRFYRAIARYASAHLRPQPSARLWLEINSALASQTAELVASFGFSCQILNDAYGNCRFLRATPRS